MTFYRLYIKTVTPLVMLHLNFFSFLSKRSRLFILGGIQATAFPVTYNVHEGLVPLLIHFIGNIKKIWHAYLIGCTFIPAVLRRYKRGTYQSVAFISLSPTLSNATKTEKNVLFESSCMLNSIHKFADFKRWNECYPGSVRYEWYLLFYSVIHYEFLRVGQTGNFSHTSAIAPGNVLRVTRAFRRISLSLTLRRNQTP